MERKYFIGIDFGHGETTVSRVPGYNGEPVSQVALRATRRGEKKTIPSAICKKGGEWSLVYGVDDYKDPEMRKGFKGMIGSISPTDRQSLKIFAELIFKAIIENDSDLEYTSHEQRNFSLGIACPSDWVNKDKGAREAYLSFFRDECQLPVDLCINESDAAYFSKYYKYNVEDSIFVVDLGSSTIDFTTIAGAKAVKKCCWGANLGAHLIEDLIVNSLLQATDVADAEQRKQKSAQRRAAIERVNQMRKDANFIGTADTAISLLIREAKEEYYTERRPGFPINITYRDLIDPSNWKGDMDELFAPCLYTMMSAEQYENIISSYVTSLGNVIQQAKMRLDEHGIVPTRVLLSGGACRMPFVREFVERYFATSRIDIDQQPECVVSNGVALFASAYFNAQQQLLSKLADIDFSALYKDADKLATYTAVERLLPEVMEVVTTGYNKSGAGICDTICGFIKGLGPKNARFSAIVNQLVTNRINDKIRAAVAEAIKQVFGIDSDTSSIDVTLKNVVVMSFGEDNFGPGGAIYNRVRYWIANAKFMWRTFGFNWEKLRDEDDRREIATNVEQRLKTFISEDGAIVYPQQGLSEIANSLKQQTVAEALDIFVQYQLFEGTYKA
ncbi:MAG: hypothetical protein J6K33_07445 [Alistipes sp.]|nr:hypothetical protein [Alistipes sp.]